MKSKAFYSIRSPLGYLEMDHMKEIIGMYHFSTWAGCVISRANTEVEKGVCLKVTHTHTHVRAHAKNNTKIQPQIVSQFLRKRKPARHAHNLSLTTINLSQISFTLDLTCCHAIAVAADDARHFSCIDIDHWDCGLAMFAMMSRSWAQFLLVLSMMHGDDSKSETFGDSIPGRGESWKLKTILCGGCA